MDRINERIAKDMDGKFILAKASTDENQNAVQEFGIMSIPAVKLFKDGQVVDEFIGAQPEESIRNWLNQKL